MLHVVSPGNLTPLHERNRPSHICQLLLKAVFSCLQDAVVQTITTAEPLAAARRVTVFGPSNEAFEAASDAFAGADEDAIANVRTPSSPVPL